MQVRVHHLPAQENRLVHMTAEVDDADGVAAVFVAIRQVVDQIAGSRESRLFELLARLGPAPGSARTGVSAVMVTRLF